ncbi:MAG: hypothetical protein ACKO0Z_18825 [Betaproteobacteria bacterium]
MNWLNRFLLANWSWLMDGMLLLMALIIGIQVGESHVHKEWNAEKSKNEQISAKLEQHVEDVKLMQSQINQEISNDFLKKSKLLAERLPDPRFVGVCNIPTTGGRDLPAVPNTSGSVAKAASDDLPASSGDEVSLSCSKLADDASQTTLMLIEFQLWFERQLQFGK